MSAPSLLEVSHRTRKRVTIHLLPFIFVIFLISWIERGSVAFAYPRMSADLSFSREVYRMSVILFIIGYLVFGVPGTIIVERWSARKWIGCIMIMCGMFTILSAFIRTGGQFYITQFAWGLAEASLFPGLLAYLTH